MKVLIYGDGWLGKRFVKFFDAEMSPMLVTSTSSIENELKRKKPDVVINCAGKTGSPNVDWCEDHKLETLVGNVTVPLILAQACLQQGVYFVHLSSGCIYEGDNNGKGFSETDEPNFFGSFYSRTKIIAEDALKEFPVLILRLRMPFDTVPDPRNKITVIASHKKVIEISNSVTVIDDLLSTTKQLVERRAIGIYNVTNPGSISHKEFLQMYKEIVDLTHTCEFITLEQLYTFTKAKRSNCVLNTNKLTREGIQIRPVKDAVRDCLEKYKQNFVNKN